MSDKTPKTSWVKLKNQQSDQEQGQQYNQGFHDPKSQAQNQAQKDRVQSNISINSVTDFLLVPNVKQNSNPETIRRTEDEKYFYKPSNHTNAKPQGSSWFIVTFLMISVVIVGLYFYVLLEEKNNQISGLEREISNKSNNQNLDKNNPKSGQVKGVFEDLTNKSEAKNNSENLKTSQNPSQTNGTISSNTFTILGDVKTLGFESEKIDTQIPYLNNQNATKTTLSSTFSESGKTLTDKIEIFSLEMSQSSDKSTIINNLLKQNPQYQVDQKVDIETLKSQNNLLFTKLTPKTATNTDNSVFYVAQSAEYNYIIQVTNNSKNKAARAKINDFLDTFITKTSFN
jgi:hypothetical protein